MEPLIGGTQQTWNCMRRWGAVLACAPRHSLGHFFNFVRSACFAARRAAWIPLCVYWVPPFTDLRTEFDGQSNRLAKLFWGARQGPRILWLTPLRQESRSWMQAKITKLGSSRPSLHYGTPFHEPHVCGSPGHGHPYQIT